MNQTAVVVAAAVAGVGTAVLVASHLEGGTGRLAAGGAAAGWEEAAVERFGVTSPDDAIAAMDADAMRGVTGFVLPDGRLVTATRWGGMTHPDMATQIADAAGVHRGSDFALSRILSSGWVRVLRSGRGEHAHVGVEIRRPMTAAQHRVVARLMRGADHVYVDVTDRMGMPRSSLYAGSLVSERNAVLEQASAAARRRAGARAAGGRVPAEPGTLPVPPGAVRLYHYTGSLEQLDRIAREGLRVSEARGHTYGEPDGVWASAERPRDFKPFVEFWARPDEITIGGPDAWRVRSDADLRDWERRKGNVLLRGDVPRSRFLAVHYPWQHTYRLLEAEPERAEFLREGEGYSLTGDPDADEGIRRYFEDHPR